MAVLLLSLPAAPARAGGEGEGSEAAPGLIASGGLVLFYRSEGPLSFVSMTPRDVPAGARPLGTVRGVSCQRGLSIPLSADIRGTSLSGGYGDGGFARAVAQMKKERPELAGIYDVRTDLRVFSILGIYRKLCTEVTARAFASEARSGR